jgi:glutamate synthase (NADPH) small chain
MPKTTGFIRFTRQEPGKAPVDDRIAHYREFEESLPPDELHQQAHRCMDCGIPFCHVYGCPVHNRIPEWIDAIYRNDWRRALNLLHATDNFPEITGRVCPAPCETACTLGLNQPPVLIRHIELQIVERGFAEGWIIPEPAPTPTGRKVAVIGSGPAGLTAAQDLARLGHAVTVFEKSDRIGGLLRYGIPDYKLEKWVLDRRIEQMVAEGVTFEAGVEAGRDLSPRYLERSFDAIVLAIGAGVPRDLPVAGRKLRGVHFAMDFLSEQNRRNAGDVIRKSSAITATGKRVVILGGGDTGSDCIGTSIRQGAASVKQFEIMPEPPVERADDNPWPTWPRILRTSTAQEEGCERRFAVATRELFGERVVQGLRCVEVDWRPDEETGAMVPHDIAGSEFEIEADLVLLAMGFLHVAVKPLVTGLELEIDKRGNIVVDEKMMTTRPGVFSAGDSVEGASLVVRAFHSGRVAAANVDAYLMKD